METLSLKIEQYEGPLDLLLALIAKHKLNIFDIPISEIAEQYMDYINSMKELNMEVTSVLSRWRPS
jgi:segregation and condensation protein A